MSKKTALKNSDKKIRLTITSDLTGFQQILLLSHFKKRFFVSLAMRSLFTFNVCGFLCCEGMCLILLVVHAQCTVQVQQLHKKINHGPDAMAKVAMQANGRVELFFEGNPVSPGE